MFAALLVATVTSASATAQTTNLALYQEMAVECLGALPPQLERIELEAPDEMPYLRSTLVATWQDAGRQVYLPDGPGNEARVSYDVEEAVVRYARRGRRLARDVRLTLRYTIARADGRVLADDRCARSRGDVIARGEVDAVQSEAYPETQSDLPRGGWFRRVLEPAVLTGATAVAVYLFFTLRSAGGDDS